MGMFDNIRCKYPLPLDGLNDRVFQTKDTPAQLLDLYEIKEDGTLWHEQYDIEDHSRAAMWERDNPGQVAPKELGPFLGCGSAVNKRWEPEPMTGEICFYDFPTGDHLDGGWLEFSAYFVDGEIREINLIKNTPPNAASPPQADTGPSVPIPVTVHVTE